MPAIIVVDALWGDSGKGKVASYLAETRGAELCVRAGTGTNSGHSLHRGEAAFKTSQIPLAGLLSGAVLGIGSGVAVDPELVEAEAVRYSPWDVRNRLRIDPRCPVILPEYREAEAADRHFTEVIGSTLSGTGYTQAQACLRKAPQARDIPSLEPYLADVARVVFDTCERGGTVVVEGSQGTQLSQGFSPDYPLCTSGNCTSMAAADDVGLNWRHIGEVVLVVKAAPSRVGNGPLPGELSPEQQDNLGLAEYGVRTGRRRRKSLEMPWDLIDEAVRLNGPTALALTFCDHLEPAIATTRVPGQAVRRLIADLEARTGVPVILLDCGKDYEDLVPWSSTSEVQLPADR